MKRLNAVFAAFVVLTMCLCSTYGQVVPKAMRIKVPLSNLTGTYAYVVFDLGTATVSGNDIIIHTGTGGGGGGGAPTTWNDGSGLVGVGSNTTFKSANSYLTVAGANSGNNSTFTFTINTGAGGLIVSNQSILALAPGGGSDGQVLTRQSGALAWTTISAGSVNTWNTNLVNGSFNLWATSDAFSFTNDLSQAAIFAFYNVGGAPVLGLHSVLVVQSGAVLSGLATLTTANGNSTLTLNSGIHTNGMTGAGTFNGTVTVNNDSTVTGLFTAGSMSSATVTSGGRRLHEALTNFVIAAATAVLDGYATLVNSGGSVSFAFNNGIITNGWTAALTLNGAVAMNSTLTVSGNATLSAAGIFTCGTLNAAVINSSGGTNSGVSLVNGGGGNITIVVNGGTTSFAPTSSGGTLTLYPTPSTNSFVWANAIGGWIADTVGSIASSNSVAVSEYNNRTASGSTYGIKWTTAQTVSQSVYATRALGMPAGANGWGSSTALTFYVTTTNPVPFRFTAPNYSQFSTTLAATVSRTLIAISTNNLGVWQGDASTNSWAMETDCLTINGGTNIIEDVPKWSLTIVK